MLQCEVFGCVTNYDNTHDLIFYSWRCIDFLFLSILRTFGSHYDVNEGRKTGVQNARWNLCGRGSNTDTVTVNGRGSNTDSKWQRQLY